MVRLSHGEENSVDMKKNSGGERECNLEGRGSAGDEILSRVPHVSSVLKKLLRYSAVN